MNNHDTQNQSLLPRAATRRLTSALGAMPVVVVMGARQTGKSTLTQLVPEASERAYVTLDDFDVLAQARDNPADLVRRASLLTIDEVQREPDVLLAVKRAVDEERPRRSGRFLLTGSANLLLMNRVSESLAGRASYVTLWPLTRREQLRLGSAGIWSMLLSEPVAAWPDLVQSEDVPTEDWQTLVRRGGYPTPAHELQTDEQRRLWFEGYVATYLERDLQMLSAIDNIVEFRRLMRAAFLRIGNVLNQADLARDVGIPRPTAHRYLNLLEASYQVVRVEAYAVNRTKRLIKAPKLYAGDVGLAMHVGSAETPTGAHLENLILTDLLAWRAAERERAEILYWRTVEGAEVDFVIEVGDTLLPVEVKASARPVPADARHIKTFHEQYGEAVRGGLVLHTGDQTFWLTQNVLAVPWWRVV